MFTKVMGRCLQRLYADVYKGLNQTFTKVISRCLQGYKQMFTKVISQCLQRL